MNHRVPPRETEIVHSESDYERTRMLQAEHDDGEVRRGGKEQSPLVLIVQIQISIQATDAPPVTIDSCSINIINISR
jgi:hypothetical protein